MTRVYEGCDHHLGQMFTYHTIPHHREGDWNNPLKVTFMPLLRLANTKYSTEKYLNTVFCIWNVYFVFVDTTKYYPSWPSSNELPSRIVKRYVFSYNPHHIMLILVDWCKHDLKKNFPLMIATHENFCRSFLCENYPPALPPPPKKVVVQSHKFRR